MDERGLRRLARPGWFPSMEWFSRVERPNSGSSGLTAKVMPYNIENGTASAWSPPRKRPGGWRGYWTKNPEEYWTDHLPPTDGLGTSLNQLPRARGFRGPRGPRVTQYSEGGSKRKTLKKKRRVRSSTKKGRGRR